MSNINGLRDKNDLDRLVKDSMDKPMSYSVDIPGNDSDSLILSRTKGIMTRMVEYKELMMMNACAIKEIKTKFEILNTEFSLKYHRNPIHSINSRLKSASSIAAKMEKMGKEFTLENIENSMHDIAGVRVICPYIDDIYTIANALLNQDDITYVTKKDYIKNPKPNGYRSLHLIVKVPVFFADRKQSMTVEVQIRTIAMDFWASLEHQLRYKDDSEVDEEILNRLRECADTINETDKEMLKIRSDIEAMSDKPTEEELLWERFSKIDLQLL